MDVSGLKTELVQFIRETIRERGPQSFAWFMEQALYHPEHGYYSSGRAVIGRKGDYFTNVSVGPLFGQLLAAQFVEIWERLGKIDNFTITEQGAHDGQFARDVLNSIRAKAPEFFSALRYRIIEPFRVWQDRQSQTLESFCDKVEWGALERFSGVHFSNELLDAMPVNLRGKLVDLRDENFIFVEGETKPSRAVLDWVDNIAANLERGFVIAIDYGFAREEFREVLQVRAQHRLLDSPFQQIGEADITMHVNWTEMAERAEANGLRIAGFTDQHHFITGIISTWPELLPARLLDSTALSSRVRMTDVDAKTKRALQTLLHPEMMGRAFQILALFKTAAGTAATTEDVDLATPLAGFKFARNPRAALGI